MRLNLKMLCLRGVIVGYLLATGLPSGVAADANQEIAARALLGEAEKLIELALPQEALPILDEVQVTYPETEAADYANLRRAQALMFAHQYDQAVAVAQQTVSSYPGQIISCWAQCVVGQSLLFQGKVAAAIRELWKVEGMLPNQADLGPLNEAREVLGRAAEEYLASRSDDLDAVGYLGLDPADIRNRAKTLAILAAYRAREGRFADAEDALNRLASACPGEAAELGWAKAEVALSCLTKLSPQDAEASQAAATLSYLASTWPRGHHSGARASLALGRYYKRTNDPNSAAAALEEGIARFAATANLAEMLYQLGGIYYTLGRSDEALATLKRLVADHPRSGFAAPALYCIGAHAGADYAAAVEALTQLAAGGYDRTWRGLALWKLGGLYGVRDKAKARDCYLGAIEIVRTCLAEQKADAGETWREMLQARLAAMEAEMRDLGVDE